MIKSYDGRCFGITSAIGTLDNNHWRPFLLITSMDAQWPPQSEPRSHIYCRTYDRISPQNSSPSTFAIFSQLWYELWTDKVLCIHKPRICNHYMISVAWCTDNEMANLSLGPCQWSVLGICSPNDMLQVFVWHYDRRKPSETVCKMLQNTPNGFTYGRASSSCVIMTLCLQSLA